jgi:phosphatidylserine/phosphatidylglycerophosphate/cardiolipin synthase-like enzyme
MGRKPILDALASVQHSVDLVMYGMTDDQILNALIQEKRSGKTVKVLLERSPYKTESENSKAIQALNTNQVSWQGNIPPLRLIHQKTLIIDDQKAVVMTFNFTRSTFSKERNFALVIDDPRKVGVITSIFTADWNHKPASTTSPDILLSPDDSRQKLLSLIVGARKSISIYAQNVSDYQIVGALAKAARKGISVRLLTSEKMRGKQAQYLDRAGVIVHQSTQYMIHAKVFIIDDELAVIGSVNLTKASFEDNRELSIISRDKNVISSLNATFDKDWGGKADIAAKRLKLRVSKRDIDHAVRLIDKFARKYLDSLN